MEISPESRNPEGNPPPRRTHLRQYKRSVAYTGLKPARNGMEKDVCKDLCWEGGNEPERFGCTRLGMVDILRKKNEDLILRGKRRRKRKYLGHGIGIRSFGRTVFGNSSCF